jgi:hypothetical protein
MQVLVARGRGCFEGEKRTCNLSKWMQVLVARGRGCCEGEKRTCNLSKGMLTIMLGT